jgi:hypothetical protein
MDVTRKLVEIVLSEVEKALLDGEKFPHGKTWDPEQETKDFQMAVPRIVFTYDRLKQNQQNADLLSKIFYLARDIDKPYTSDRTLRWCIKDEHLLLDFYEIAKKGREQSLENPKTTLERIEQAKLFSNEAGELFAAQLKDPKRGCSASICTNCDEPIAFGHYKCGICNYELIGAHGMPTVESWNRMSVSRRLWALSDGYHHMRIDIIQRGDWRGQDSPLNRFKDPKKEWGGFSYVSGGAPLTKVTGLE